MITEQQPLIATVGAYLDDAFQEADLMERVTTDAERSLAYGLIVSSWSLYYGRRSTRLDHNPSGVLNDLIAQGPTTQQQFDDYLSQLISKS